VLGALEACGYDRSFEHVRRAQEGPLAPARAVPSFREIERDERTRTIRLPPALRLDLGGTAKGWSADEAASMLAAFGPALVDLGGDIAARGAPLEPWPIAVEDPRCPPEVLALVLLRDGGIATTGRDHRRWTRGGVEHHHVIDPRTGRPAETDVWTATVIAGSALDAEIAAKRLFLEGSRSGLAWIEQQRGLAALVVRADGQVVQSTRFAKHLMEDSP
jgi:thiamine biosynthesis lipoprotein